MAWLCCSCCQVPEYTEDNPLIVDVVKVLSDKAWKDFINRFGYCKRKFINPNDYVIQVPENYYSFDQAGDVDYFPVGNLLVQSVGRSGALSNKVDNGDKTKKKKEHEHSPPPKTVLPNEDISTPPTIEDVDKSESHDNGGDERTADSTISLDTTFSNSTALLQSYQFKFSKARTSTINVSYQKGFTLGGKASFSIGLPKNMMLGSIGLEAEKRLEVTKSEGQSFEETWTMEATSEIKVNSKTKCVAKVQMDERTIHSAFKVRIRMSMPQGHARIYIRKKSSNLLVAVCKVSDLEDIFFPQKDISPYPSVMKVDKDEKGDGRGDVVDFLVQGIMKGTIACAHTIDLNDGSKG